MVRLWVRPDGSFAYTVYADEDPASVADTNALLAPQFPDATPEDYTNDDFEAMTPKDGSDPGTWKRQGKGIVAGPPAPKTPTLEDRLAAIERRLGP